MQKGREGPRGDGEKYAGVFDNKNRALESPWPQTLALCRAETRGREGSSVVPVGPVSWCRESLGRVGVWDKGRQCRGAEPPWHEHRERGGVQGWHTCSYKWWDWISFGHVGIVAMRMPGSHGAVLRAGSAVRCRGAELVLGPSHRTVGRRAASQVGC